MSDTFGYAVYSELEERYLQQLRPSEWHYDLASAVRFDTEGAARAACNRRQAMLAVPIRIYQTGERLSFDLLPRVVAPAGGLWVVRLKDAKTPSRDWYAVSVGKMVKITTESQGAKGYKTEAGAQAAAAKVNAIPGMTATAVQITAKVIPFSSSTSPSTE